MTEELEQLKQIFVDSYEADLPIKNLDTPLELIDKISSQLEPLGCVDASVVDEKLLTTFKINDEPLKCKPIEALKILIAAIPHNKYDGSDTEEHWNKIDGWLNELLHKASQHST